MQRLTLLTAKAIVATTKTLLPLIYMRDMINIAHAYSAITMARARMMMNLKTQEDAFTAIKEMQAALPASLLEARAHVEAALIEIKKLAHRESDPLRLPTRRLRRQASRIVAKEERRLTRGRQEHMGA